MVHGSAMAGLTVQMVKMKPIVLHNSKTKDYGTVVMASVFQHHMFVMDLLQPVMQVGVQTVLMAQMKV
jgi:hypothetical protein